MNKFMNVVTVVHSLYPTYQQHYTFKVPIEKKLHKGDMVICKNRRGDLLPSMCVTDSHYVHEEVAKEMTGHNKKPCSWVVGILNQEMWEVTK